MAVETDGGFVVDDGFDGFYVLSLQAFLSFEKLEGGMEEEQREP